MCASTRAFHLGHIISLQHDLMMGPDNKIEAVREILQYLTGRKVNMSQLVASWNFCKPRLAVEFPQLAKIDAKSLEMMIEGAKIVGGKDSVDRTVDAWLAEQVKNFGDW